MIFPTCVLRTQPSLFLFLSFGRPLCRISSTSSSGRAGRPSSCSASELLLAISSALGRFVISGRYHISSQLGCTNMTNFVPNLSRLPKSCIRRKVEEGGGATTEEGRRRSEGGGAYLLHTILLSNITYGQFSRQIYYGLNCPFDMPFNTRYDIQFTCKRFIQEHFSTV